MESLPAAPRRPYIKGKWGLNHSQIQEHGLSYQQEVEGPMRAPPLAQPTSAAPRNKTPSDNSKAKNLFESPGSEIFYQRNLHKDFTSTCPLYDSTAAQFWNSINSFEKESLILDCVSTHETKSLIHATHPPTCKPMWAWKCCLSLRGRRY